MNGTKILNQWLETMKIDESDMDAGFLNCFIFHKNFTDLYEQNNVRTKDLKCRVNDKRSSKHVKIDDCKFDPSSHEISFNTTWNQSIHMGPLIEIYVDLQCEINVIEHPVLDYLFNQPVIIRYTSSRTPIPQSISNPPSTNKAATTSIVVVLVTLALTSSIVVYYKRMKRKRRGTCIKWEENPLHVSESFHASDEDQLLPSWLSERNDMIFDGSCILMGNKLGHGNFGAVFEGKIKLGSAMYIFFIFQFNSFYHA